MPAGRGFPGLAGPCGHRGPGQAGLPEPPLHPRLLVRGLGPDPSPGPLLPRVRV